MSCKQSVVIVATAAIAFAAGTTAPWGYGAATAQPARDKPAQPGKPAKPDKPTQPDSDAVMAELMAKMQPGEHHRKLDALLGKWEGGVKFWMAPGTDPMESTGTVTREWTLDNRFIIEHVDGQSPGGPPFKGLGLLGYNTLENRYESAWLENMATYITFMTGKYDDAKKSLTFQGDVLNPITGKRERQRHVVDLSNPNRQAMVGYCVGPDGKEFKNFEGTFTKTK